MRSILVLLILVMIGLNGKGQSVTALPDSVLSQCCLEVTLLNGNVTTVDWVFIQYITRDGTGTKLFVEYAPNFGGIQWETQIRIQDDFDDVIERSKFIILPFTVGSTDYGINRNWIANIEENTTTGGTWIYGRFGTPAKRKFSAVEDYETLKNLLLACRPRAIVVAENGLYTEGDTVRMGGFLIEPTTIDANNYDFTIIDSLINLKFELRYQSPDTTFTFNRLFGIGGNNTWSFGRGEVTNSIYYGLTSDITVYSRNNNGNPTFQAIATKDSLTSSFNISHNGGGFLSYNLNQDDVAEFTIGQNAAALRMVTNDLAVDDVQFGAFHSIAEDRNYLTIETPNVDNGTARPGQFLSLVDSLSGEVEWATIDPVDSILYATRYWTSSNFFPLEGGTLTGTGGTGFIGLPSQVTAPSTPLSGLNIYAQGSSFNFKGTDGYERQFGGTITGGRSYLLPDVNGTLALGTGTADRLSRWNGTNTQTAGNLSDNGTKLQALLPWQFHSWTTAGRPTGVDGYVGRNSTTGFLEGYYTSRWENIITSTGAANGQVSIFSSAGQTYGTDKFFWNNSNELLELRSSNLSPSATRGLVIRQENNNLNGAIMQFQKIRGSSAVQNGDILGVFSFRGYDGGGYLTDNAIFGGIITGAVSSGTTPTSIVFNAGSSGANYNTQLLVHHNNRVGVGDFGSIVGGAGAITAPSEKLHIRGGNVFVDGQSTNDARYFFVNSLANGTNTRGGFISWVGGNSGGSNERFLSLQAFPPAYTNTAYGGSFVAGNYVLSTFNFSAAASVNQRFHFLIGSASNLTDTVEYTFNRAIPASGNAVTATTRYAAIANRGIQFPGTTTSGRILSKINQYWIAYNVDSTAFNYRDNSGWHLFATRAYARSLVSALPTTNIYTADGSLTANRTLTGGSFWLNLNSNAGIKQSSPTQELDVNGDVYIRDSTRIGTLPNQTTATKILSADVNGWVGYRDASSFAPNTVYTASDSIRGDRYLEMANDGSASAALGNWPGFPNRDYDYATEFGIYVSPTNGEVSLTNKNSTLNLYNTRSNMTSGIGDLAAVEVNGVSYTALLRTRSKSNNDNYAQFNVDSTRFRFSNILSSVEYFYSLPLPSTSSPVTGTGLKQNIVWTAGTPAFEYVKKDTTIYIDDADYDWSAAISTATIALKFNRVIFLITTTGAAGSDSELTLHTPDSNLMQVEYLIRSTDEAGGFTNVIQFGSNNAVSSANALVSSYTPSAGQGVGIRAGLRSGVYKYWYY